MLYDKDGVAYILGHQHDDMLYVRPLVKTLTQITSDYGETYEEFEDSEPAGHFVAFPVGQLYPEPPTKIVAAEAAEAQASLKELRRELEATKKGLEAEVARCRSDLQRQKAELNQWMQSHKVLIDAGKLLDGTVLYPLAPEISGRKEIPHPPSVPEVFNTDLLVLSAGGPKRGGRWTIRSNTGGNSLPIVFYYSKEERWDGIVERFKDACNLFRDVVMSELDVVTGDVWPYALIRNYGILEQWVHKFPALSMPEDISTAKESHDSAKREEQRLALIARLQSLEEGAAKKKED